MWNVSQEGHRLLCATEAAYFLLPLFFFPPACLPHAAPSHPSLSLSPSLDSKVGHGHSLAGLQCWFCR